MSLWNDLGFSDNPYSTRPVPGDELGESLLVGRDVELRRLARYLRSSDTHPTLEGPNGVGKTSLTSVASYRAKREWVEGVHQQALIPAGEPFQLTPDDALPEFKRRVFFRVAQAFIDNHEKLRNRGFSVPDIDRINQWLNSPIIGGRSLGLSLTGAGGLNAGTTASANSSAGFTEAGFAAAVTGWLRDCFPTNASGGFICVIDNLELLETSRSARALLEALRDEVLGVQGLRWVLCGARGIVRSAASSPRLQGVLAEPINLDPIGEEHIQPLITARLNAFKIDVSPVAPVEPQGFEHLFKVGNRNLRNAFKYSEDFSFWAADHGLEKLPSEDKYHLLEAWMAETSDNYLRDTTGVGRRAWEVFDALVQKGGATSPSEYAEFGFESNQAMRPHLRALEEANMIESAIDESDNRRKTISVTPRGWIVNYRRSGFVSLGAE